MDTIACQKDYCAKMFTSKSAHGYVFTSWKPS
jgi:hypothetical protein